MDRTHYRMCSDSYLIETALYAPNAELAIVLAERLEEVQIENDEKVEALRERAADFESDALELDDKIYNLQQKIDVLELMLATRDETIEELKKGN
jgi:chromosome segregation ATPase